MKFKIVTFSLLVLIGISVSAVAQGKRQPPVPVVRTGNLHLEAGLVFKNGDVKPVARVEFLLLRNNPENLIRTRELHSMYESDASQHKLESGQRIFERTAFDGWTFRSAALAINTFVAPNFFRAANKVLAENSVASGVTGFDGKATFENVPVGDFFIFGKYKVEEQAAVWSVVVTIKSGANKMILDNNNFIRQE